jgi:hypothetical protein
MRHRRPDERHAFLDEVEQVLAPTLKPGDVVVLDNLSAHKMPGIHEAVEAAGARLLCSFSQNSKPCSEKPPSAPSTVSGTASHAF